MTSSLAANEERKHLEGLLKDRINFFLVFVPVVLAASYSVEGGLRAWTLLAAAMVSFVMALAILRTHLLVQLALEDVLKDPNHPYTKYKKAVRFPPSANLLLVPIPFLISLGLAVLAAFAFCPSLSN